MLLCLVANRSKVSFGEVIASGAGSTRRMTTVGSTPSAIATVAANPASASTQRIRDAFNTPPPWVINDSVAREHIMGHRRVRGNRISADESGNKRSRPRARDETCAKAWTGKGKINH